MADVLLAMRPEWLELILSGRKTAEFRRVRLREVRCARQIMDEVTRIYSLLLEAGLVDGKEGNNE